MPKTYEGAEVAQNRGQFGLSMPKNPYNNLLFDHIDGFEFFTIFWVQNLSYLPLLQEGTTWLGSSHNRPWLHSILPKGLPQLTSSSIGQIVPLYANVHAEFKWNAAFKV